jgi:hypothetical protein
MSRVKVVRNDTRPRTFSLLDGNGNPLDVSGSTTLFKLRPAGSTTVKASVPCTLLTGKMLEDGATIDATAPYNVAGAGGRVRVDWTPTALDTAGEFEGEFEVTYADSSVETVYELVKVTIRKDF